MADELHVKGKDLKDLKVVELKKELSERGLTVTGNKSELLARLEDFLLKQGDDLEEIEVEGVLESDIEQIGNRDFDQEISEDTYDEQEENSEQDSKAEQSDEKVEEQSENIPPHPEEPVKIKLNVDHEIGKAEKKFPLSATKTPSEIKVERQQRFGVPLSEKEKKQARAERFGTTGNNTSATRLTSSGITKNAVDVEKLSKRAERFGAVSPLVTKTVEEERLKKRKERFGVTTGGLPSDAELHGRKQTLNDHIKLLSDKLQTLARKRMRAERFK